MRELSVLIVDDNKGFVQRMTGILDELENVWNIQTAGTYEEAICKMEQHRHDLVLLDINLPGKSGISLLKKLRQSQWKGDIIMMSNLAGEVYRQHCTQLGANCFLDKTAEFDRIPLLLSGDQITSKVAMQ